MFLWKVQKGNVGLSGKWMLLGYPIYEIIDKEDIRIRNFCQGLISSHKIYDYIHGTRLKDFLVCGIRISRFGTQNFYRIGNILGISIYKKSVMDIAYQKYKYIIPTETDYIFVVSSGLGEIYHFVSLILNIFLQKNHIRHPLFLVTEKYHLDLFKMLVPQYPAFLVNKKYFFDYNDEFSIHGVRGRYLFSLSYFRWVENTILKNNAHFVNCMFKYFDITPKEAQPLTVRIPSGLENKVAERLTLLGLAERNYVFLSTQARSCENLPQEFWQALIDTLNKQGFKVLLNNESNNLRGDLYYLPLSVEEAFVAAQRSCFIVGLRSGLMDILLQTQRPMYVIYTGFSARSYFPALSSSNVQKGFDLNQISFLKNNSVFSYLYHSNLLQQLNRSWKCIKR